jgi:hypothetical protein
MANVNNPFGLRSLGLTLSGGAPQIELFDKVVGYGTAVFPGDAVNQVADGSIEKSATPGSTLYSGVALDYGAASKATNHLVVVSPDAVFVTQCDDDGTGLVATDRGINCNLVLGAGSATTYKSGHQLHSTTKNTTSSLDMKLRRLFPVGDNAYGVYARWEVVFNNHRNAMGTTAV